MLKLGYKASAEQFAPTKLLDFSIEAEKVELDSVFVSDHFQPWKHVDGHAPSSLVWLGALAARTSSLMIGTSVLTPTFRYHPSIVAQAFGTLGAMAPGRVILGIGTGEGLNEVPSTGAPWPEFKERFARMREAVTLIRKLWREERVSFEGEYYKTEKATIYDRPNVEIPIYVAAAGAVVARYAGRTGDGFICTSGKAINRIEDFKGQKIRAASRQSSKLLARLGATPVGMPITAVADAMNKGTIEADGGNVLMSARSANALSPRPSRQSASTGQPNTITAP